MGTDVLQMDPEEQDFWVRSYGQSTGDSGQAENRSVVSMQKGQLGRHPGNV